MTRRGPTTPVRLCSSSRRVRRWTGICKQGTYSGPFTTDFYLTPDAGSTYGLPTDASIVQMMGTVTLDVTPSMAGEFNYDVSGAFHADSTSLISSDAQLSGSLDCSSGKLSGQISNGTYSGWLVIMGTFEGPMSADYDGTRFAFVNGVWNLSVKNAGLVQNGMLPGTWSASYVGDP